VEGGRENSHLGTFLDPVYLTGYLVTKPFDFEDIFVSVDNVDLD
jgi:hypothetical protein